MAQTKEFLVPSSDGIHTLNGIIYLPKGEIKGFFHVVHGMTEHKGRYDRILSVMADEGYLAFAYDNLGHGLTVKSKDEFGFIADKKGYDLLCRDVKLFSDAVRSEYDNDLKLPYILMGHSMGSFIVRLATERYVKPDKLIVMGTGGPNPIAGAGLALIAIIKLFRGKKHFSPLIHKLSTGGYNDKFDDDAEGLKNAWLTTDMEVRRRNASDPLCKFKFSVSAMGDLIRLLKYSNRSAWYKKLPKNMPILLVSGKDDPVGDFGRGVEKVYGRMQKNGLNATLRLYEGARHEILNDFTYEQTKNDILDFTEDTL